MDIRTLINRLDNIEQNNSSIKQYISEGLYSTPEMQQHWKRLDEGFFKGYEKYLAEVALTPDQIQNIFKQASGSAGGESPKDPGKLAAIVDKVLPTSQAASLGSSLPEPNAGPVQGFEQKAAAAVQNLGVDSGTKQSLMQMVKAGIKKPETQQLILAAVGAGLGSLISKIGPVLSMIPGGGPVAAAVTGAVVAGGVAVLAAKLRGEDWKSAFKGAIKPALMGGASAVVGNLVTTAVSSMTSGGGQQQPADAGKGADATTQKRGDADWNNPNTVNKNPDGSPMTADQIAQAKADLRYGNTHDMSDPNAPVGGGMKNFDGSPMTNAQMSANMDKVAPIAGSDADPNKYYNSLSPDQQKATDDAIYNQAKDSAQVGRTVPMQAQSDAAMAAGGDNPYAQQAKDQMALNQRMQAQTDAGGSEPPAKIVPRLPPGAKLSDFSNTSGGAIGQNFDAGIAPTGPDGTPMKAVPMDEPAAPQGINRLTGKPLQAAPAWDQMSPDQQAAVTARQQQQAADAAQGTQNAKDYWANKNPNTRGLKESFAESAYVDKQATLRMWLDQEAQGLAVSGLALKPVVKEGIMDSLKGMFGGKKGAAAPAAGGVTADALNKAWTAAGSPTDSEEVAKVLQGAGVPAETVNKVFADLKLPAPGSAPETPADAEQPADATATTPETDPAAADSAAPEVPGATPTDAEKPADAEKGAAAPAVGMQADEIVKAISTFWDQVKSNQDSKSSAPAVQQQIKAMAKDAGMTGQVFESKYWNNK